MGKNAEIERKWTILKKFSWIKECDLGQFDIQRNSLIYKDIERAMEEYASQQKPEIALLSEDEINIISLEYGDDDIAKHAMNRLQSELKTRIQPSDLQKEVERLKEVAKDFKEYIDAVIKENGLTHHTDRMRAKINEALNK